MPLNSTLRPDINSGPVRARPFVPTSTPVRFAPDAIALDERLARYALVSYARWRPGDAPTSRHLAAVDLERARVTFRGTLRAGASPVTTFHVGGNGYARWWTPALDTDTLVALDGHGGELRAVQIRGRVARHHIANGKIWIVGTGDATIDRLPVTILDATTLAPTYVRGGIRATDVTRVVRQQLGL